MAKLKKFKVRKGFTIAITTEGEYQVFTNDEWAMGGGFRYPEFECGTNLQECYDQIDYYGVE